MNELIEVARKRDSIQYSLKVSRRRRDVRVCIYGLELFGRGYSSRTKRKVKERDKANRENASIKREKSPGVRKLSF